MTVHADLHLSRSGGNSLSPCSLGALAHRLVRSVTDTEALLGGFIISHGDSLLTMLWQRVHSILP